MADEASNQNELNAAASPADGTHRAAAEPSQVESRIESPIDMSPFEAQFRDSPATGDVHQVELPSQRQPGVEWAIEWADGRITRVHSEAAARLVAERHPGCQAVCRIVGPWGRL
jgi:hypothetical protein